MPTHFEESLERDVERIRGKVTEMANLAERGLMDCLRALREKNRQLAYTVILRDQKIDELEKELDRLCLEFLVRQQPVAGPLRFAYVCIRLNLELERVGDYAESIARQVIKLIGMDTTVPIERLTQIANLAVPMLRDAVQSFLKQDAALATRTIVVEETVDTLRNEINNELVELRQQNKIPLEALTPLMTIARRFERVSDQAKNICQEVLYMCTGEYQKHQGSEYFRLLFVDKENSGLSQMAEGIGNSLSRSEFIFTSAGTDPQPIDPTTTTFLKEKGIDISHQSSKAISQVPNLEHYQVVIVLSKEAEKAFPPPPRKTVFLQWNVSDPSKATGTPDAIRAAFEKAFQELSSHIHDLGEAILGHKLS